MKPTGSRPRRYATRNEAEHAAHCYNACTAGNARHLRVAVEQEGEGWWAMDLPEAIDAGFTYSWSAPPRRRAA